jgi:hypothetical protein
VTTRAQEALALAERGACGTREEPVCTCEFVDIGIGLQKVAETPDCPYCTELGYACWALENGTPAEKAAAQAYLAEWETRMSADAVAAALEG